MPDAVRPAGAASVGPAGLAGLAGEVVAPMARPRTRRRPRRRLRRLVALGALALVALLYYRPLHAYEHASRTVETQTAQVRALEARKHRLEQRLSEVRSGATLVRAARRLGMVKPGEELFIVRGIQAWRRAHARR